jgi:enamine deaminase RidA (YjgF/YER057c/UK114 family)
VKQRVDSGTEWERIVGYSRAVRVGNHVYVSGTTAIDREGNVVGEGDAEVQTRAILERIALALIECGGSLVDVVRTRIFVTDISRWEEIGRVHGEYFGSTRPATTMVQVAELIDSRMLVEIEADAYVES